MGSDYFYLSDVYLIDVIGLNLKFSESLNELACFSGLENLMSWSILSFIIRFRSRLELKEGSLALIFWLNYELSLDNIKSLSLLISSFLTFSVVSRFCFNFKRFDYSWSLPSFLLLFSSSFNNCGVWYLFFGDIFYEF